MTPKNRQSTSEESSVRNDQQNQNWDSGQRRDTNDWNNTNQPNMKAGHAKEASKDEMEKGNQMEDSDAVP